MFRTNVCLGDASDKRELLYVVDVPASASAGSPLLRLMARDRKPDGSFMRVS